MPEPVVMGLGWGRIRRDRQQIDCGSILYPSQRDHGLMKEEREGWEGGWTVLGVSDETTATQRLLTHSHTPTHRHRGFTSHLLGDRKDLMFV